MRTKRKREIRKLEEMLGLKRSGHLNPDIKVWTPKEENLHRKIKEINRRRLRITETVSALRGFARKESHVTVRESLCKWREEIFKI